MKKIMIVDDDPSLLALAQSFLKQEYEVVGFSNGLVALEAVAKVNPDLILTDVLMPEMTGYDFLTNLKRPDSPLKTVPVIVMSARESLESVFAEQTIFSFLPKPFTRDELRQAVSRVFTISKEKSL